MRVALIAGGTGGAKLAAGLQAILPRGDLSVVANTGDDLEWWGLHVSPDLDSVLYRLAGIFNEAAGFGVKDETFQVAAVMERLGEPAWFRVGDQDLATHLLRTAMLRRGLRLSEASLELGRRLAVRSRVLPMSDDPVRTWFATDQGCLGFQEYFVREACRPRVEGVEFAGLDRARPAPEAVGAVREADLVVIGPSNPVVSVDPVLALLKSELRPARTLAVSPIVGGVALKGPTVELMRALGRDPTPLGVAREYREVAGWFVLDERDRGAAAEVEREGLRVVVADTVMGDQPEKLAKAILEVI